MFICNLGISNSPVIGFQVKRKYSNMKFLMEKGMLMTYNLEGNK